MRNKIKNIILAGLVALSCYSCKEKPTWEHKPIETKTLVDKIKEDLTGKIFDISDANLTQDTINEIVDANVLVTHFTDTGSGVILCNKEEKEFYVLTSNHVISKFQGLNIKTTIRTEDMVLSTSTYKKDPQKDLALLKIEDKNFFLFKERCFQGKVAPKVEKGYFVLGAGYLDPALQGEFVPVLIEAKITGKTKIQGKDYTLTNNHFNPGNSGGGLYSLSFGKPYLIGAMEKVSTIYFGLNYVTSINNLHNFLEGTPMEHYL